MLLFIERLRHGCLRRATGLYMRSTLQRTGRGCIFGRNLRFYGKQLIALGDDVIVNDGVTLQSCEGAPISIGNRVTLSYDCMILTGGLDRTRGGSSREHVFGPVVIEDDVWLGARCIILPHVTVGSRCLVAAGAVVTRDLPADSIAAGVPARVIRRLNEAADQ